MEIFRLFGSVFLKDEEVNKSLSNIDKRAKTTGERISDMGKKALKAGTVIATGMAAAGGALLKLATSSAEATDRIDKLSQRLGLSREGFQEWDFVLSQAGVSIESLQGGMKTLTQRMGDAINNTGKGAEAFSKLRVNVRDTTGAVKTQEQVFNEVVTALQKMPDGMEKASLAQDLFARSGQELLPLLNGTAESVEALKKEAQELGLVMSDDTIDAGVKFTDTMDKFKRSMSAVKTQIGANLMPKINELLETIIKKSPEISRVLEKAVTIIVGLFKAFGNIILFVTDNFNWLLPIITAAVGLLIGFKVLSVINALMKMWTASTFAQTLAQSGLNAAMLANPIGLVIVAIVALIAVGVALWQNWDWIIKKLNSFWQGIKKIYTTINDFVVGIFHGMADVVRGIFDGLLSGIEFILNKIINGINWVIRLLNNFSFKLPSWLGGGEFGFNIREIREVRFSADKVGKSWVNQPEKSTNYNYNNSSSSNDTYNISLDTKNIKEVEDLSRMMNEAKQTNRQFAN
ncbi:phage tail tape measure protein [Vallitalea pronyensis]|uniref:Phage tail tape measure protein n=1 Tax=Vallitalea pronyensis TaxID=1348613 RepID=A0A8J8MNB7_9FIRM|nr:phage tail tape measure protein [Vallitalea pronyensis]QUI24870.1 phage tail tape measure protein [Vallitalea pronyensis]